jgi:hypothetical protein
VTHLLTSVLNTEEAGEREEEEEEAGEREEKADLNTCGEGGERTERETKSGLPARVTRCIFSMHRLIKMA